MLHYTAGWASTVSITHADRVISSKWLVLMYGGKKEERRNLQEQDLGAHERVQVESGAKEPAWYPFTSLSIVPFFCAPLSLAGAVPLSPAFPEASFLE